MLEELEAVDGHFGSMKSRPFPYGAMIGMNGFGGRDG